MKEDTLCGFMSTQGIVLSHMNNLSPLGAAYLTLIVSDVSPEHSLKCFIIYHFVVTINKCLNKRDPMRM